MDLRSNKPIPAEVRFNTRSDDIDIAKRRNGTAYLVFNFDRRDTHENILRRIGVAMRDMAEEISNQLDRETSYRGLVPWGEQNINKDVNGYKRPADEYSEAPDIYP